MDLQKVLASKYSKAQVNKIVAYVGKDASRFQTLVDIYLAGPSRITQRASWPMSYCVEAYPKLIIPHLKAILDQAEQPGAHDAVKRNTVRLLQFIDIPKRFQGRVADLCFGFLQNKGEAVAIKAFSITVLSKLVEYEPDLKNELKLIIEEQLPYASPAFRVRARLWLEVSG